MSESYSEYATMNSIDLIRKQIQNKINYDSPSYFNLNGPEYLHNTITDMDHFPYKRFYRGQYDKTYPTVME